MGGRQRCSECRRILIPSGEPPTNIPMPEGIEDVLPKLVPWAREFDAATPADEPMTAIDFLDWMALNAAAEGYTVPAGRPGSKDKAA